MTSYAPLLIELLCEELPAKEILRLLNALAQMLAQSLQSEGFVEDPQISAFATPRRLSVRILDVYPIAKTKRIERRGPSVQQALDALGQPTPALLGFARGCHTEWQKLAKKTVGENEYFFHVFEQEGKPLENVLAELLLRFFKTAPARKSMRWGEYFSFTRPVRSLLAILGNRPVSMAVGSLQSQATTSGHRLMGKANIAISDASQYEVILEEEGWVIPAWEKRQRLIEEGIAKAKGDAIPLLPEELLQELVGLCEYPVVLSGHFDERFLAVPQECLIIAMQSHQRYIPLLDVKGHLTPRFLFVANNQGSDPEMIIHGNERVLRARLSDAAFFFEQDCKIPLLERLPKLRHVMYVEHLGSMLARVDRLESLSEALATKIGLNPSDVRLAASLAKADLATEMVAEFPELEGIIGAHYARLEGYPEPVCQAIAEHLLPKQAGDPLPVTELGALLSLADKLEALVGLYAIGMVPSGDKDPYGLRRNALGIVRLLLQQTWPITVPDLVGAAARVFAPDLVTKTLQEDIASFMLERAKGIFREEGFGLQTIDAVFAVFDGNLVDAKKRLQAVQYFLQLPEAATLAAANKRIGNILRKAAFTEEIQVLEGMLHLDAEKSLYDAIQHLEPVIVTHFAHKHYEEALMALASLKKPIDDFFDQVLVMDENSEIRHNRLALLQRLYRLMNHIADLGRIAI
jgi:glycyl-tRNA synthetase beta chain